MYRYWPSVVLLVTIHIVVGNSHTPYSVTLSLTIYIVTDECKTERRIPGYNLSLSAILQRLRSDTLSLAIYIVIGNCSAQRHIFSNDLHRYYSISNCSTQRHIASSDDLHRYWQL